MVDRDVPAAPRSDSIYGWALRPAEATPCAGCGVLMGTGYQLRVLTLGGWTDVAGRQWCLRCWSGDAAGPAGRGLGNPPPREP